MTTKASRVIELHSIEPSAGSRPRGTAETRITFQPGFPVPAFGIGRTAQLRVEAAAVEPLHLFLQFDGRQMRASGVLGLVDPARVDGVPLPAHWVAIPDECEIALGDARLRLRYAEVVEDVPARARIATPPTAGLDETRRIDLSSRLDLPLGIAALSAGSVRDATAVAPDATILLERAVALAATKTDERAAATAETIVLRDGLPSMAPVTACSVAQAPPPAYEDPRRRASAIVIARVHPSARPRRAQSVVRVAIAALFTLAVALVVRVWTVKEFTRAAATAHAASAATQSATVPPPPCGPAPSGEATPAEASATPASDRPHEANPTDRRATEDPPSGEHAVDDVAPTNPLPAEAPDVPRGSGDSAEPGLTDERRAVDAVAQGDFARAADLYDQLARENPSSSAFAQAARIARRKARSR